MSAVVEKLIEARKLIEQGWTQGDWAKDCDGLSSFESDPEAVCWCAGGAMYRAAGRGVSAPQLFDAFQRANSLESVLSWNDASQRTQAEVLAAFDKAIELARAEAGQ